MIPKTGSISLDDFNTEFGYSAETAASWQQIISSMRTWDGSSEVSMLEWRGYDEDTWKGWFSGADAVYTENINPTPSVLEVDVTNNSKYEAKSETLYYRFLDSFDNVNLSGSVSTGTIATDTTTTVSDSFGGGFPWDRLQIRFTTSASWQTLLTN